MEKVSSVLCFLNSQNALSRSLIDFKMSLVTQSSVLCFICTSLIGDILFTIERKSVLNFDHASITLSEVITELQSAFNKFV